MKTDRPTTRAGFTMIELLIVILLMSIMMSILVSLVRAVTGTSRQAATRSTIIKISRMLENRTRAFHRFMDKLDQRAGTERFPRYVKRRHLLQAGGRRNLALILARKDEFRRHFQQMFSEDNDFKSNIVILNWPQFIPDGTDRTPKTNFVIGNHFKETESAECLYYFLTQGETFGAELIAADAFSSREVMDTDGDGLLEFVDSWGNPLRFYRWPTRLIRRNFSSALDDPQIVQNTNNEVLNRNFKFKINETAASVIFGPLPAVPAGIKRLPESDGATFEHELEDPLSRDGDDPLGLTFRSKNSLPRFDRLMSPANFEKRYHTASTYHIPLIISAGPDEEPGLYEPHDGPYNVKNGTYNDKKFGRLAQPIIDPNSSDRVDERLYDDISNIFLRSGVTR